MFQNFFTDTLILILYATYSFIILVYFIILYFYQIS